MEEGYKVFAKTLDVPGTEGIGAANPDEVGNPPRERRVTLILGQGRWSVLMRRAIPGKWRDALSEPRPWALCGRDCV
jgi:hypothetical protein